MNSGKVWLVGAGPGDPGLMTIRGKEVLSGADVVIYDALISPGIINLIPDDAEKIFAGKRAGNHFLKQEETNRLLLEKAQTGKKVVRLKGGDPFLFGRGGEELELLAKNDIPFEIVPGITSAFAVPAYSGIPVTHRDYCSDVHVITGHKRQGGEYDIDFQALVKTGGTLIFLMGITSLPVIMNGLIDAGMDPDMPAAVIEKGTTSEQRCISASAGTLADVCEKEKVKTPAIIIVGKVCSLEKEFSWYSERPLSGVRVIVTRPKDQAGKLSGMLREEGAEVLELPAINLKPVEDDKEVMQAIDALKANGFDWVVFTSPGGVRIFFDMLLKACDLRVLGNVKIAALGTGTAGALKEYGIRADMIPSVYEGRTLGRELAALLNGDERILIPRAAIGNKELTEELEKVVRTPVTDVATYDTVYEKSDLFDIKELAENESFDMAVFTSASTVRGFAAAAEDADLSCIKAVCIGEQTAAAAAEFGMKTEIAKKATLKDLVEAVKKAASDRKING